MNGLKLKAHAKINLFLRIVGRRPDGFHDLESVFQSITLHDTLTLEKATAGIDLVVEGADLPADGRNLVRRAADLLVERSRGLRPGVRARLIKRIPVGSGLGGASSDAAAALVGLNRLWDLSLSKDEIVELSGRLGSDVPYFLTGGTALVTGRGDKVQALPDLTPSPLLIVIPDEPISTASIYAQVSVPLTPSAKTGSIPRFRSSLAGGLDEWVRAGNDLEPIARRQCPAIGTIQERLRAAGAYAVAMTGSGSAVFGAFREIDTRTCAATEMERAGWSTKACSPLSRQGYRKTLGLH